MNSIYLRSIGDNLRSCKSLRKCDDCKKVHNMYICGLLSFCCTACANNYHLKYDVAASSHSIFSLFWLKETILDNDIIIFLTRLLYKLRKRSEPNYICTNCEYEGRSFQFVDDYPLCSKRCRYKFYKDQCYSIKEIKNFTIKDKSNKELTEEYEWEHYKW